MVYTSALYTVYTFTRLAFTYFPSAVVADGGTTTEKNTTITIGDVL